METFDLYTPFVIPANSKLICLMLRIRASASNFPYILHNNSLKKRCIVGLLTLKAFSGTCLTTMRMGNRMRPNLEVSFTKNCSRYVPYIR